MTTLTRTQAMLWILLLFSVANIGLGIKCMEAYRATMARLDERYHKVECLHYLPGWATHSDD